MFIWDGKDNTGTPVPSGTLIEFYARFASEALHVPLWDVEGSVAGIRITDVRPASSFDFIFWARLFAGKRIRKSWRWNRGRISGRIQPPQALEVTNTIRHDWPFRLGNRITVNTWSYGFFQSNAEVITYYYTCDNDNDGIGNFTDFDDDNDGIPDTLESRSTVAKNYAGDTDGDGIPNYLDPDQADWIDSDNNGVNDLYDIDGDRIPDALDLDSDNDGIPDVTEAGGIAGSNGRISGFTDTSPQDGTHDPLAANPLPFPDSDGDGLPNFRDLDSDGDGIPDVIETGAATASTDGGRSSFTDATSDIANIKDGWDEQQSRFSRYATQQRQRQPTQLPRPR